MLKLSKMLFTSTLITSSLLTMSSYSWITMWMGLEINMMSMIPLMTTKKNTYSSESAMKYFIIQSMASTILIMSLIQMSTKGPFLDIANLTLNSAIMLKMGIAPFHFWYTEVIEGLMWSNCLIMMTWQKIAPISMIMSMDKSQPMIIMSIVSSMLVSGLMGINQTSLRKILAYSSINHMAWMMAAMMESELILFTYFIMYSFITTLTITLFKMNNLFHTKQLFSSNKSNQQTKTAFMMNFMSMGGLPPFLGFIPKWITINSMIESNNLSLSLMMVTLTLITLFFYIRLVGPSLTQKLSTLTWSLKSFWTTGVLINTLNVLSMIMITVWFNQ